MPHGEIAPNFKLKQISGDCLNGVEKLCLCFGLKNLLNKESIFTVGRGTNCDFRFDAKDLPCLISRQHAEITVSGSELFVTDLKSVNGTFVNDVMLESNVKTKLNIGDTVTFGCLSLDDAICPGKIVKQDNALFKFVLMNNGISQFECRQNSHCDLLDSKDTSDQGSGTSNISSSPSAVTKVAREIAESLTSEVQNEKNHSMQDSEDKTMPLTVRNLIAFSGCSFKDMQFSSDEKENQSGRRMSTGSIPSKNKAKYTRKRRHTATFTRKKRRRDRNESCAYYECKIKEKSSRQSADFISWVQCDGCDKWYHTDCIGCDYNMVRSAKRKFNCGLC